jgi:hypothetical protein
MGLAVRGPGTNSPKTDALERRLQGSMDERILAIRREFDRYGYELIIEESNRGGHRGGWLARYRSTSQGVAVDRVAHGNTEREAAEVALARFRSARPR